MKNHTADRLHIDPVLTGHFEVLERFNIHLQKGVDNFSVVSTIPAGQASTQNPDENIDGSSNKRSEIFNPDDSYTVSGLVCDIHTQLNRIWYDVVKPRSIQCSLIVLGFMARGTYRLEHYLKHISKQQSH